MRQALPILLLVTATTATAGAAEPIVADPNRPKCTFHVFTDTEEVWPLTAGPPGRKWLVMNVGNNSVLLTGSEATSPGHPPHEEVVLPASSTIAAMKHGHPSVRLSDKRYQATVVVCRYFGGE